jgi:hypothetical protein
VDTLQNFLAELRDHWDDGYWWADRQLLLTALIFVAAGAFDLAVHYGKLRITQAAAITPV